MKFIITIIFSLTISLLSGQNGIIITNPENTVSVNELRRNYDGAEQSFDKIEGLAALSSLESLSALEGLESLEALENLEGLEALEGLRSLSILKTMDALEHVSNGLEYNINCTDISSSKRSTERKEHKIPMSSGELILKNLEQVKITGYSGSEIVISASTETNNDHDERSRGLRVVNSLGIDDNTGLGLNATKEGNTLSIYQVSKSCCDDDLEIKVPFGITLDISNNGLGSGDIDISDIKDEIVISTSYGDINLNEVSGPLAIKTVYGSIEAVMESIPTQGSISLYSVYGLLDFTIPQNTKADIEISTPYGEILTNVDIDVTTSSDMRRLSNKKIRGTVNGGGLDISLKSGYDNIYLRNK